MTKKMVHMAKPLLGEEEEKAVLEVLRSGMLAQGSVVEEFEKAFADYIGVKYAIATSSGTTALHVALLACGIGEGDEVITTPFSFIATANCILYAGAKPVFVDIDPQTYNIDVTQFANAITARTKAVIPVHLYGLPADMLDIGLIAGRYGITVVEDAAQAHGATIHNRRVGSFGDAACFSFYPTKNMTSGEGGMITTNCIDVVDRAQMLRNHGMRVHYYHDELGYNFRMSDIHAAIGLVQLGKLDAFNRTRFSNAAHLSSRVSERYNVPFVPPGYRHVFHQYTVRLPEDADRENLRKRLKQAGFGSEVYYPIPIHLQETFLGKGGKGQFPVSEEASQRVLSLPIHPSVTFRDLDRMEEVLLCV